MFFKLADDAAVRFSNYSPSRVDPTEPRERSRRDSSHSSDTFEPCAGCARWMAVPE
jgi:hypothetical protein